VSEPDSLAFGPTNDSSLGHDGILYLSVQGELPSGEESPKNPTTLLQIPPDKTSYRVILGTLRVPAGTDPAPTPTLDGVQAFIDLASQLVIGSPVKKNSGTDTSLNDTFLSGTGASTLDRDRDTITDDSENCVYAYNPLQEDNGGLLTPSFDGIGDACQCGDLMVGLSGAGRDGAVMPEDVRAGLLFLAGAPTDEATEKLCSVAKGAGETGADCNIKDMVVLQRATRPNGSGNIEQTCSRGQPDPNSGQ
jgi:hypothetical protein